jgi:two-component system phosphate regulon response regulator PhoB
MAKSVLIIEDNPDARFMYSLALEHAGYTVFEAEDGPEGIGKAVEIRPTLVLLDIGLPIMDGWEVCRILKTKPETADIPIIVLTASAFLHEQASSATCAYDTFITKPVAPLRVLDEIQRLIGPP